MKALVWTGPEQMELQAVEEPEVRPGWVKLEVKAVGICGSELSGYLGQNSLRVPPLVMGHEFSGVVTDAGDDDSAKLLGQLVTVNPLVSCGNCRFCLSGNRQLCNKRKIIGVNYPGAFAEFVAVPASLCHPVREPFLGAMVEPLACSLRAVNQVSVEIGDVAVVIGAGIIGLMAMHVLKLGGAREVIAIDTNATRLESTKVWGATKLLNPNEMDTLKEIRSLFPEGVDRVIDAVGYSQTRSHAIGVLRRGGSAVFIGLHENDTKLPGNDIVRDEIEIRGTFCYSDMDFRTAVDLVNQIPYEASGYWLDTRPLADGGNAFEEQIKGAATYSKIILIP